VDFLHLVSYIVIQKGATGDVMKKDTVLSIRLSVPQRKKLSELAESKGMTLAELVRSALSGLTWETEFERNIEYHQSAIKELRELQRVMRATQRARSKAVTGEAVAPKKREQLNALAKHPVRTFPKRRVAHAR